MIPDSEITFKISGSALSFLYYECDKSKTDQVGFLIGEKLSYIKKTISDTQVNGEKNETIINIVSVLPVSSPFLFSNYGGRIDKIKLKQILGPLEKDIYGWYVFKRNADLNVSLRSLILHKELLAALPHISPESFSLCCVGLDTTQARSTHCFSHNFLLYSNAFRVFKPISVPVVNLGQPEETGYRTLGVTTNSSNSSFNKILSVSSLSNQLGGLAALKELQKPLQKQIMEIAAEVQVFDQKTIQLMDEIEDMKKDIFFQRLQNSSLLYNKKGDENIQCESDGDKDKAEDCEVDVELKNDVKEDTDCKDVIFCSQEIDKSAFIAKSNNTPPNPKLTAVPRLETELPQTLRESSTPTFLQPSPEF